MAVIAAPVSHKNDAEMLSILPGINGQLLCGSRFIVIVVETLRGGGGGGGKNFTSCTKSRKYKSL